MATSAACAPSSGTCSASTFRAAKRTSSASDLLSLCTLCLCTAYSRPKVADSQSHTCSRFLESLCDYLYDSLRPRILHEPRLDALCDLCAVLHAMMALDASTSGPLDPNASDDDDDADLIREEEEDADDGGAAQQNQVGHALTTTLGHGFGSLRFAVLLQTILQDAQTRLVFRAQAVIQSDVLHYQPTPDDLDYPEKLLRLEAGEKTLWHDDDEQEDVDEGPGGARGGPPSRKEKHRAAAAASLFDAQVKAAMQSAGPMAAAAASKLSARFKAPSEQTQKTWFPTLKRTVWVLSRLDAYVNVRLHPVFCRCLVWGAVRARADPFFLAGRMPFSKILRARPSPSVDNRSPLRPS